MKKLYIFESTFLYSVLLKCVICEIEYNNVNPDGSFSFRHINNDLGSFYHSVAGNSDNSVRGRYGSRNPSSGKVEETVYTAGKRGFRVNGPQVYRKMDLSQLPRGPVGNLDDPLADPYDDPTYSFSFKTPEYNRNENADSTGRIKGLYSYLDDIGERHTVRYAAGAGIGFEILNQVPDSPSTIAYSAPLYKTSSKTRGKIAIQRSPKGFYKFVATGPDHRRSEISGPDGIVRGAYSYLDDKGVQRTVKYEAGAGIGYRIVQNIIGRGTHINTNVHQLSQNDFNLKDYLQNSNDDSHGIKNEGRKKSRAHSRPKYGVDGYKRVDIRLKSDTRKFNNDSIDDDELLKKTEKDEKNTNNLRSKSAKFNQTESSNFKGKENSFDDLDFDNNLSSLPPLIASNRRILETDREQDWNFRNRDSTIIKNVGKWFVGLPPGQSVRAHVQNIDILPIGGRLPSPSEALHKDEINI